MTGKQLRQKRMSVELPANLVAAKAGIDNARLSRIELGYIAGNPLELERIEQAIKALVEARKEVKATAERVGWPL